jgi:hypothetical protein
LGLLLRSLETLAATCSWPDEVVLHSEGRNSLSFPYARVSDTAKKHLQVAQVEELKWQIPTIRCKVPWFLGKMREFWAEFAEIGFSNGKIA